MRLLLDTSAYSAFMRGHAEIRVAVQSNEEIFLNSVILGELIAGSSKTGGGGKTKMSFEGFSHLLA
jgi:predicted nucleic acid-binding protein